MKKKPIRKIKQRMDETNGDLTILFIIILFGIGVVMGILARCLIRTNF